MGKKIGAVIAGYAVMFVLIFASFSAAYFAMGADRAFQPGTYRVTPLWMVTSVVLGTVAALIGGAVCARISKGAVKGLAVLVIVLGILFAIPAMTDARDPNAVRASGPANLDAMQNAVTPVWMALLNPLIGAVGVMIGGGACPIAAKRARGAAA